MNDYTFFLDPINKNQKSTIYSADKLQIEIHSNESNAYQAFNIVIDKHNQQNTIQIRLTNLKDKTKMFVCNIDDGRFESFKVEQSLHVTFDGFVKHLMQILEHCRKSKLNVSIQMDNNTAGQLEFYEKGSFKNLVHISLPIEPAPIELIMFAINQSYAFLQEANKLSAQKCSNLEMELLQRNERIDRLNETIQRLKNDLTEQEQVAAHRVKEQMVRMEQEIKHVGDTNEFQRQELEKQINAYRNRIDTLVKDSFSLSEQFKRETTQTTQLRNENQELKKSLVATKEQIEMLKNGQAGQRLSAQKNDHILNDLRKQVQCLQDKVNLYEKQKSEILAELDAEKNICLIKRNGLKMATEDICNANAIIRKQAAEIVVLKEKVAWRTEVALKQEQVIREQGKENNGAKELMEFVGGAVKNNTEQSAEIKNKLESLKSKADALENKYKARISDALHEMSIIDKTENIRNNRRF